MFELYLINVTFFVLVSMMGGLVSTIDNTYDKFAKIFRVLDYKSMYESVHNWGMKLPFTYIIVGIWFSIIIPFNIFFAVNSIPFRILEKLIFSDTVKSIIMKG